MSGDVLGTGYQGRQALGATRATRCQAMLTPCLHAPTSPPEQTAARLRLAVLILLGLVLVGLGSLAGVYNEWTVAIFGVNLGTLYFV